MVIYDVLEDEIEDHRANFAGKDDPKVPRAITIHEILEG